MIPNKEDKSISINETIGTPSAALVGFILSILIDKVREKSLLVSSCIHLTPTGALRTAMTDANIHLLAAIEKLEEAKIIIGKEILQNESSVDNS